MFKEIHGSNMELSFLGIDRHKKVPDALQWIILTLKKNHDHRACHHKEQDWRPTAIKTDPGKFLNIQ